MQKRILAFICLLMLTSPLYAQWFSLSTPGLPRTADGSVDLSAPVPSDGNGHPDMSGLWVPVSASGTLFDSSKIKPWALDAMAEQEGTFFLNDPRFHCLPSGPGTYPAGMSVGGIRRIVQHPDIIAVLDSELNYRQIFMDGRELEETPFLSTWTGYSVGHWEGSTLVIESNGYNDQTWLTREGLPHTDALRITERYTRTDFGHIELEITYLDPETFTEPVIATIDMVFQADTEMLEVACNESETGRSHYSGEITQAEQKNIEIPEETLQKYLGTYQGEWLGNLITAEIVLEDGEMFLIRTPRYSDTGGNTDSAKSRLIAQSQNAFDCSCGLGFIFNVNDEGIANRVYEVHVSGQWAFERVR